MFFVISVILIRPMKKLILLTMISIGIFAANNQTLVLDPNLSPYIGADDLIMAHQLIEKSNFSKLAGPAFSRTPLSEKIGRFSELYFFWDPINYATVVTQHEVFGHGYRVRTMRDTGAEVLKYKIGFPPPYGNGGGSTEYQWFPSKTSIFQKTCIVSAGVESTAILANRVRLKWLRQQKIKPQQASLYLFAQQDITLYALHPASKTYGDIFEYTQLINYTYKDGTLTLKNLKNEIYANLLDPFTYYSICSSWNYILQGEETPIPMIQIGSYKYLPSVRMGLTPFGSEYYLENFLVKEDKPLYFYVRRGAFAGHQYTGIGIEDPYLWQWKSMSFGFRSDVWLQPNIDFQDSRYYCDQSPSEWSPRTFKQSRIGASLSLICQKEMWSNGAFFLQVGGKTQGYLPGEELASSMIFRVGLTLW